MAPNPGSCFSRPFLSKWGTGELPFWHCCSAAVQQRYRWAPGTEGTALSRHPRTAMLDDSRPVSAGTASRSLRAQNATFATAVRADDASVGARSAVARSRHSRRKRGPFRRMGIILPALGLAVVLVGATFGAAYVMKMRRTGASDGLAAAIGAIPQNKSVRLLEQERQTLVDMSSAARTLTVVAK